MGLFPRFSCCRLLWILGPRRGAGHLCTRPQPIPPRSGRWESRPFSDFTFFPGSATAGQSSRVARRMGLSSPFSFCRAAMGCCLFAGPELGLGFFSSMAIPLGRQRRVRTFLRGLNSVWDFFRPRQFHGTAETGSHQTVPSANSKPLLVLEFAVAGCIVEWGALARPLRGSGFARCCREPR
jgi:hypothetical protein